MLSKSTSQQLQTQGLIQLQVVQKDLQAFYKDLLRTTDVQSLEKQINDMIFNIQDCL